MEYFILRSLEKQGQGWGRRAENLIGQDDVKLLKYFAQVWLKWKGFESAKKVICVSHYSRRSFN